MPASSSIEGAVRTDQRVSALLGMALAAARTMKAVPPPARAAKDRRRLAVRVMAFASLQLLIRTAPTAPLFSASSPAASRLVASRTRTISTFSGCKPHSCSPDPCKSPVSCDASF
jgi:hypothetical protein